MGSPTLDWMENRAQLMVGFCPTIPHLYMEHLLQEHSWLRVKSSGTVTGTMPAPENRLHNI